MKTLTNNQRELHRRCKEDPVFFVNKVIGDTVWDKQKEILYSVRDNKRTTVRAGNTCGKTVGAVYTGLWFTHNFKDSIVIVTSPTLHQMTDVFFRTLAKIHSESDHPLGGELTKTSLTLGDKHFLKGFCFKEGSNAPPEGIAGHHSDTGILFIIDECTAVPDSIFDAIEGSLNTDNAKLLMIGNPLRLDGEFYKSHTTSNQYNRIHISAFDVPNVKEKKVIIPGLVTHTGVEDMKQRWGEESDQFKIRVLGDFPSKGFDNIISLRGIEKAVAREVPKNGDVIIGCDVARFGDDKTAFVLKQGNYGEVLETIDRSDTMYVAGRCIYWLNEIKDSRIKVDSIGVGAGVVDRLKEQEEYAERVDGVNVAESATDSERYANQRSELWFKAKEWLDGEVGLKQHDGWTQLSVPNYHINSRGKYQVESKDSIKKRVGSSPDIADAFCLCFSEKEEEHYHKIIR